MEISKTCRKAGGVFSNGGKEAEPPSVQIQSSTPTTSIHTLSTHSSLPGLEGMADDGEMVPLAPAPVTMALDLDEVHRHLTGAPSDGENPESYHSVVTRWLGSVEVMYETT
ncbi:hypothetical protein DFH07DRAFT_947966 [Mycena maculata]|uniref:Uncharacterized protein n=1 Tax=Mycena maculata TaxID=230809 RepID=A0AAD7P2C7_9AGAR|nr:hypothetical protein DFH07DRAFT_947966 [Mycena maculata]